MILKVTLKPNDKQVTCYVDVYVMNVHFNDIEHSGHLLT